MTKTIMMTAKTAKNGEIMTAILTDDSSSDGLTKVVLRVVSAEES